MKKDETKEVLAILIDVIKKQNEALKEMNEKIDSVSGRVSELEDCIDQSLDLIDAHLTEIKAKSNKSEVHNHYHNNYSYPRYPYYTPIWGAGGAWTGGGAVTINGGNTTNTTTFPPNTKEQ